MPPSPNSPGPAGHGAIYSTQHGKMCPKCSRPLAGCVCARMNQAARESELDGVVRVGRETKGRKGAGVTVVLGVPGDQAELKVVAKELKKRCGTGGTVKDGVIEIQGDHRDAIVAELTKKGWTVKKSGG